MCMYTLEYVHLYPFWDLLRLLNSNPITSNPTLLLLLLHTPRTCSLTHKYTRSLDFSHLDQQPFMLLDYCCRCFGFTLIKRHGAFSLKTTPSDTWVRKLYNVGERARIEIKECL